MFEVYSLRSGSRDRVRWQEPHSLAIAMDFDGPQPSCFVASPARRHPLIVGGFTGDIQLGGSCRVDVVELVPHGHGTHTETISHVADPFVPVGTTCPGQLQLARLISVTPRPAHATDESYSMPLPASDQVITVRDLLCGRSDLEGASALIIRTLPNPPEKRAWHYRSSPPPAFFTHEAMQAIVDAGVEHLLVDLPSVDRMDDGGLLTNHRRFWNVQSRSTRWTDPIAARRTISELLYISDEIPDGFYALMISVPSWRTDAAPSQPFLYFLEPP